MKDNPDKVRKSVGFGKEIIHAPPRDKCKKKLII